MRITGTLRHLASRLLPGRGVSPAAMVHGLAGAPAGVVIRRSRRGSVLVLILGALALISVVTLIYVTIGKGDRRTGAVNQRRESVDQTAERVKNYIANELIGADVTSAAVGLVDSGDPTGPTFTLREAWDYPSTDWSTVSTPVSPGAPTPQELALRFNPVGSYRIAWPDAATLDPRVPSDPWLASPEPTWIKFVSGLLPVNHLEQSLDWLKISNIAPDGRFVNLYNLAPYVTSVGARVNNFDARSGFGTYDRGGGVMYPCISGERDDPADPATPGCLTLIVYNAGVNGASIFMPWSLQTPFGINSTRSDPRVPANWDSYQWRAYRPARDPNYTLLTDPAKAWEESNRPEYQWADADGDGLMDARWQELVDAFDPENISSVLPRDDHFRWFVASRIVDLSGRVNVNSASSSYTAGDITKRPTRDYPVGATAAETDLRRLLTMYDNYVFYQDASKGFTPGEGYAGGYDAIKPPKGSGPDNYQAYTSEVAYNVGDKGYASLRLAIYESAIRPVGDYSPAYVPWSAQERYDYYYDVGSRLGTASYRAGTYELGGLFGKMDLLELLSYRNANNYEVTSRLESAVAGRFGPTYWNYDVLRSNRPFNIERDRRDELAGGSTTGGTDGVADPSWIMRQSVFDVRQRLTTFSGARQLRSGLIDPSFEGVVDAASELRIDAAAILRDASDTDLDTRETGRSELFRAYADALMPYSGLPDAWNDPRLRTLAYGFKAGDGHNANELAAITSAHLTVNSIDAFDDDDPTSAGLNRNIPTVMTVLMDSTQRTTLDSDPINWPWWQDQGGKLDLGDDRLGDGTTALKSRALTVYGVEAQPFVTQVASLMFLTDAPKSAGGDEEDTDGDPGTVEPITIDCTHPASGTPNADFLGQAVAFQLHNPFDFPIGLSRSDPSVTQGTLLSDGDFTEYYVEVGGNFFNLEELEYKTVLGKTTAQLKAIVLGPGETRVFYALSDKPEEIQAAWTNADAGVASDAFDRALKKQLTMATGSTTAPVLIPMVDSTSGKVLVAAADLLGSRDAASDDGKKVVRLWRALRRDTEVGASNSRANDLLADRIHDPKSGRPALERRWTGAANSTITGTARPADDSGFSICYWGTIKRRDNPNAPIGALPGYCLESRVDGAIDRRLTNAWRADAASSPPGKSDFPGASTDTTLPGLAGKLDGTALINTLVQEPKNKTGDTLPANRSGQSYLTRYPEILLNNKHFESTVGATHSTLRVTDMLLPLGVGPSSDPIVGTDPGSTSNDVGWITLAESMALACNFYTFADVADPHRDLGGISGPGMAKVDRGNLVLDNFAPYFDTNANGVFDVAGDRRTLPGIPLALGVLEMFHTTNPEFATTVRMTPGLVSLNTSTISVLRTAGILSPARTWPGGPAQFWGAGETRLPQVDTDVAATTVAYRDKAVVQDRDLNALSFQNQGFRPDQGLAGDGRTGFAAAARTGIKAIREDQGFATLGEIMCLINDSSGAAGRANKDSIDFLGFNGATNNSIEGVSTAAYQNPPGSGTYVSNEIRDDYAEKLAIAGSVMNTASVRSDVYAAWFVIQGYQRTDLDNLKPGDPILPSVAKRYLMVVDRSNVTRKGDKPRILLFQEVPLVRPG